MTRELTLETIENYYYLSKNDPNPIPFNEAWHYLGFDNFAQAAQEFFENFNFLDDKDYCSFITYATKKSFVVSNQIIVTSTQALEILGISIPCFRQWALGTNRKEGDYIIKLFQKHDKIKEQDLNLA